MKKLTAICFVIVALLQGFLAPMRELHRSQAGAVVTSDFLAGLLTGYRVIWQKAIDEYAPALNQWKMISTEFPSTGKEESYGWMGAPPGMEEWRDVRQYKSLDAYSYTLTNVHYEGTIEVDRDTLADDKYGMIAPRIRGLAGRALRHFNERVFSILDDNGNAYDGTSMFATTRTIGNSGNIDNLLSGAYSESSSEIRAAMEAAIAKMALYQDEWGKPINLVPDTIVCAPAMHIPILDALLPAVAGTERPVKGFFAVDRIISNAFIDADTLDWYILCTKGVEVSPIIFQMRQKPEFVALDDPKSSHVFKNKTFLYGVDDRFVVGYGDPRTAIKIVDSS